MSDNAFHPGERWGDIGPGGLSDLLGARRPVVYFAAKIGDSVMTLPTVRALGQMFTSPITVVAPRVAFDLCFHEASPHLVDATGVPEAGPTSLPHRLPDCEKLAAQIGEVDVLINTMNSPVPSETFDRLRQLLAPPKTVGFESRYQEYDAAVPKQAWHSCDETFKLARLFDSSAHIESYSQPVSIPPSVAREARSVRAALPAGIKVLAVHADTDWTEKRWPITRFIDLLDRFLSRHREFVVWVVGMGHEELNVGREGARVYSHLGLPLDLSMGMVANADLFLGIDSCMLHAADLARVPGVGMFGPTRSLRWGFRFAPHRHLDQRTMADITVDDVLRALDELADERT